MFFGRIPQRVQRGETLFAGVWSARGLLQPLWAAHIIFRGYSTTKRSKYLMEVALLWVFRWISLMADLIVKSF